MCRLVFNIDFQSWLSMVNFGIALPTVQSGVDIVLFCNDFNISQMQVELEFENLPCSEPLSKIKENLHVVIIKCVFLLLGF